MCDTPENFSIKMHHNIRGRSFNLLNTQYVKIYFYKKNLLNINLQPFYTPLLSPWLSLSKLLLSESSNWADNLYNFVWIHEYIFKSWGNLIFFWRSITRSVVCVDFILTFKMEHRMRDEREFFHDLCNLNNLTKWKKYFRI